MALRSTLCVCMWGKNLGFCSSAARKSEVRHPLLSSLVVFSWELHDEHPGGIVPWGGGLESRASRKSGVVFCVKPRRAGEHQTGSCGQWVQTDVFWLGRKMGICA